MRSLLALLVMAPAVFADPLQFIPKEAGVVIKVETPRALIESAVQRDAWKSMQAFPQVKEALGSAEIRRLFQVLTYIENETGAKWPELLDKVAGNGIALGFKPGMDPAPTLVAIEGRDEATVEKVYTILIAGIRDEARRKGTLKFSEGTYEATKYFSLGNDLHYTRVGTRTFFSNKLAVLKIGVDLAHGRSDHESVLNHPTFVKARSLVGSEAAAWLWFDFSTAKATKEGKDFFENYRKNLFQLLVFGSTVDAASRSDFLVTGLYLKPDGYAFSLRMPAKKMDLDETMRVHVPAKGHGSKALLEPSGVVFSQSFYLDLGHLWTNRKTIISAMELKGIEKGVADVSRLLPGTSLGKLFEQSGPYHRLVMAHTGEKLYKREPGQPIPAAAYVLNLREEQLGESLNGILRAAGLIATFQTGWKMSASRHDGIDIVSYTFPETGDAKFEDSDNLRFNTVPSYAKVGDSFIVASTPGMVKALIPILKSESKNAGSPEVWKFKLYAEGAANVLSTYPEATVTDAVLGQGITLAEARKQVLDLAKWVRTLGTATFSLEHGEEYFRFDSTWSFRK